MKKSVKHLIFLSLAAMSLLQSCGSGSAAGSASEEGEVIENSRLLSIRDNDGYSVVTITNPWDSLGSKNVIYLVDRDIEKAPEIPQGATKINVPVESTVLFSSTHASLLAELGKAGIIKGVCDKEYMLDPTVRKMIQEGKITDCGNTSSPNIEKLIKLKPEAVVLYGFESGTAPQQIARTGVPVIEAMEYMETTSLAECEWIKLYGRLVGKAKEADSIYAGVAKRYRELSAKTKSAKNRPKVIFDRIYGQSWNVPTSGSITGNMILDAGGENVFAEYSEHGSAQLSPEEVLLKGGDADIWMIRFYQEQPLTLSQLKKENDIYPLFKAFKTGNVYGANTLTGRVFEDGTFHPDLVLADYISVFHPELGVKPSRRYYEKVK